jgi:hypothetical protein
LFETFQDRLVKELRKANACTTEDANRVLADFLPRFNQQFAKEAVQPGSAYRPWPAEVRPTSHRLTTPGGVRGDRKKRL